ncbi:S-adenosyl-L-methionine-dependent methyltransferase [Aspergillus nidulans var. acristatus]
MLALHGFDVYGLDVSARGVTLAREYAEAELARPQAYNFGSDWASTERKGQAKGRGKVTFIEGDFFQSGWEARIKFDLIYDYTFLCALHPSMRPSWASRMADLLSPNGMLVCLEFPLYKDPKLPGPPWGLNGVYWNLLVQGGTGIVAENDEDECDGMAEGQFHRLLHIKPARSYENGRGTDMIGVYVKKPSNLR